VVALGAVAVATRGVWSPQWAAAQAPRTAQSQGPRAVSVEIANAVTKQTPVLIEALGSVTPIASVAVKSRLETEIVGVHFADGQFVKQGDLLFTLDSRMLEAQVRQAEGQLARDKAQLEGTERDVRRYTELVARSATPVTNLDNSRTASAVNRAILQVDEAIVENLKVQLGFCTIRAMISGRISTATVKVGNFVRPADLVPLATINQMAPVYVTFAVPQRSLPELRQAVNAKTARVEAIIPGEKRRSSGVVTLIENSVDPSTGMVTIRATMPNENELLWPGTLVTASLTLRTEQSVTVPVPAVQVSQQGTFVFVVKDGLASVRPVQVARNIGGDAVIASGLAEGEVVVTDGQLQLTEGARVSPRERKAGV
jgi:RND family efflux transporter MFP subunit